MQGGVQVKPGDRIVIHGLKGRPELNGQSAVLVGPAANGRINVRLESGQEIALKQENLGIQAPGGGGGMGGGGGGMPGFGGGMPGGMPGMPQGMPDVEAMMRQATAAINQALAAAGISLPPNVSIAQLGMGVLVGLFILSRFVSMMVMAMVAFAAYWGTMTDGGRSMLARGSAKASSLLRRPVPKWLPLCVLCLSVALMGHMTMSAFSGVGGARAGSAGAAVSDQDSAIARAIREAYEEGYVDGAAGSEKRPPKYIPSQEFDVGASSGSSAKSSSSGGMGSLMKYGMAGYYLYKLGKTPSGWDPQFAMANAKANPMQSGMLLMMLSGIFF
eukprot:TRINITY_DN26216_c0_g1_i1.p1 TRINITY_DN26216_c0_g1~~TRINITY_DN26216_c0_g1_i1.p1  ORF type:complete len:330 (+),score=55.77 TRINITY_DN26216_c0_g1_i1:44-1033(+)